MISTPLDGTCSSLSRVHAEPLAGTAPVAPAWLVVEQPGPWGRDALTQSHLDPAVAGALADATAALPVRVLVARRTGRHADDRRAAPRAVWTASTTPGRTWMRHHRLDDTRALLDLDLDALAAGRPDGGEPVDDPVVFVCTNARRDRCCALRGRSLALDLAARLGDDARGECRVWECSHLGGHRFSPTALVLPYGVVHGRLDTAHAMTVVGEATAGRLVLDGYRGRSTWGRPGQLAEATVRQHTGERDLDALTVGEPVPHDQGLDVPVTSADGRTWTVTVVEQESAATRPESCGKAEVPLRWLEAVHTSGV